MSPPSSQNVCPFPGNFFILFYFINLQECFTRFLLQTFRVYLSGPDEGPVFVLLHGGGHTALSWAAAVRETRGMARVMAFDLRAHGTAWAVFPPIQISAFCS